MLVEFKMQDGGNPISYNPAHILAIRMGEGGQVSVVTVLGHDMIEESYNEAVLAVNRQLTASTVKVATRRGE